MMGKHRQVLGRWGEDQAVSYLVGLGYEILARNARTPYGEIDLVARQAFNSAPGMEPPDQLTVFVEVKTRTTLAYGLPEESVTRRKQAHLLASAQAYIQDHPELDGDWRIDVIAVQRKPGRQAPSIYHFENAISDC
jgi:putative endonuclease